MPLDSKDSLPKSRFPEGVSNRLIREAEWYRTHANRQMRTYHALRTLQIIVGVSIPVLSLLLRNQLGQNITGVLGAFLAGNEAFLQFRQFPQHWKRWRIAEQDLIREAWLFDQNVGKYSDPNTKKTVLAEAVEKIIAKEHNAWVELHEKTAKGHEESHGKAKASGQ